jgi:signal transduction histidine kinase
MMLTIELLPRFRTRPDTSFERIVPMVDRPVSEARDYYSLQSAEDTGAETWNRWLPALRMYGLVVLAVALWTAKPWLSPGGWPGVLAMAIVAAQTVAFVVMWVYRPIWQHGVRTLAWHGLFLVVSYAALIAISPAFLVLQLWIYPQVVFSLALRWSIAGGFGIGVISAAVVFAGAGGDIGAALPGVATSLMTAFIVVAMAVWIRETITQSLQRQALVDQLTAARRELATAERAAGVAEERARLAREIHDTLAQAFASVVTHLEAADASLPADADRPRRHLRAAEEVARESLAEVRTLVWALRPEAIASAGLPAAIERAALAGGAGPGGPATEFAVSGEPRALQMDVEVTLLRAAQEAVANARRHAAASHITVTLTYYPDEVSLDVIDDGRGFDPSGAAKRRGLGLIGMRERSQALGGRFAIESTPGEGTAVAITLPAIAAAGQ